MKKIVYWFVMMPSLLPFPLMGVSRQGIETSRYTSESFHRQKNSDSDVRKKIKSSTATIGSNVSRPKMRQEKIVSRTSEVEYVSLPYFNSIDEKTDFADFTVIDANGDGKTWAWSSKTARIGWGYEDMDDWLIMPPMRLEAGNAYTFEFDVRGNNSSSTERFEVKMGDNPSAEAMSEILIGPTDISSSEWIHQSVDIIPEADGIYHIGIHGISTEMDGFYLYVNDVSMSAPMSLGSLSAVTDLSVIPGENGALTANVKFRAPSVLISGEPASDIVRVEVSEGDAVVGSVQSPLPGSECSVPVEFTEDGDHTLVVKAYNSEGAGVAAEATVYIGINYPAAPANVTIEETGEVGQVIVSWNEVSEDCQGFPLSPSLVSYTVMSADGSETVAEDIIGNSHTFRAVSGSEQDFVQYVIFANTERGRGAGAYTDGIFAGRPYDEFEESFADGANSHPMSIMTWGETEATWMIMSDEDISNVRSQDDDNGYILMNGRKENVHSAIGLGKISLKQMTSPGLQFYTLGLDDGEGNPDINLVEVWIKEKGASGFVKIFEQTVAELAESDAWGRVAVDLADYAGKEVELAIAGVIKFYVNIMFDNISIVEMDSHDLSVSLTGPAVAVNQTDFTLVAEVRNLGREASEGYEVELKANGETVARVSAPRLEANGSCKFDFTQQFKAIQREPVSYTAEVVSADDENPDNDISPVLVVRPKESLLPYVTDLSGKIVENGHVALSWSMPDMDSGAALNTDRFEDGEAGDKSYGEWIFVDVDDVAVSGFYGTEIPGIENNQTKASFFVFDGSLPQLNATFEAYSGNKYLASMARSDFGMVDDWAISPELTGAAQTVSFFAKSYDPRYLEEVEVYCSEGSVDPADFELVMEKTPVADKWTEYQVELPEGSRRFAIRSCAEDAMMLMLDDVSYEVSVSGESLSLKGYNVYRNNEKITSEPIAANTFEDVDADGVLSYVVTAVFETGESKASNEVSLEVDSVSAVSQEVLISVTKGEILIEGAYGQKVKLCGLDGKVLVDRIAGDTIRLSVDSGVYVVEAGGKNLKVNVR